MKANFDLLALSQLLNCLCNHKFSAVFIGESWSPTFLCFLLSGEIIYYFFFFFLFLFYFFLPFFFLLFSSFFFLPSLPSLPSLFTPLPIFPSSGISDHEARAGGVAITLPLARNQERSRSTRMAWPAHSAPQVLSRPASLRSLIPEGSQ